VVNSPTETLYFTALSTLDFARVAGEPVAAGQIFPLKPARILPCVLVVDDEGLLRWSLAETLAAAGYRVIEARTGREARGVIADDEHPIDVMLVDVRLPDGDGLQLAREARRRPIACPIIVMTAYGTADIQETALAIGAHAVVTKPFDLEEMLRLVREVCPNTT
jgi:two-component system response regulator (stage 0 sporulation protein F)